MLPILQKGIIGKIQNNSRGTVPSSSFVSVKDFGAFSSNCDAYQTPPLKAWGSIHKSQSWWTTPMKQYFQDTTGLKNMNSQRLTACMSPAQVQNRQNSNTEETKQTQIPTHDQLIPARKGKSVFSKGVSLSISHTPWKANTRQISCFCFVCAFVCVLDLWLRARAAPPVDRF